MYKQFYIRILIGTVLIILLGSPFSLSRAEYSSAEINPLSGSRIFFQKGCAQCHSILGVGGKIGPDLGKVELNYSFFGIASIMWNHAPKMLDKFTDMDIPFPKLSPLEMDALITFLSYLNYLEKPSDPERGRQLFTSKECIKCHSVGGVGGSIGPPLDKFRPYQSPIFVTTAFWNKAPEMTEAMSGLGIERPEFEGSEIMDIMAFIRENAVLPDGEYLRIYAPPGHPKAGETLFEEKQCLRCHSIRGRGGDIGPNLERPDLRISFTEIAGRMWNHGPEMWQSMAESGITVPKLSESDMSDILSYIYFAAIQEKEGNSLNGELLLNNKGCNICHPVQGKGGDPDLAPDLAERSTELELDSPTKVITAMWNHIQSMSKRVEEMGMTWPTIDSREMADITSYIVRLVKKQ